METMKSVKLNEIVNVCGTKIVIDDKPGVPGKKNPNVLWHSGFDGATRTMFVCTETTLRSLQGGVETVGLRSENRTGPKGPYTVWYIVANQFTFGS